MLAFLLAIVWLQSCDQTAKPSAAADSAAVAAKKQKEADSLKACTATIKDPNNPKPMALAMRTMASHADSIRAMILRGEKPDSADFPFIRFYLLEPTDPNVLEPQFFENARLYQQAYRDFYAHPKEPVKYFNLLINGCIHCHESYCSGPLKRIRKFPITE